MKLTISAARLAPIITEDANFQTMQHPYFCQGCMRHREQFSPDECLRIYRREGSFAAFFCPDCFRLEAPKEELRYCEECHILPAAHPETGLCQNCINDFEEFRAEAIREKLQPYAVA